MAAVALAGAGARPRRRTAVPVRGSAANRRRLGSWTDPEPWTVALLLLTGAGILARHPIARLVGSEAERPAPFTTVATAPAAVPQAMAAAGALAPLLAPAPTHAPRDPFRSLVAPSGAVLAPAAVPAAPAASPVSPAASSGCGAAVRTVPGDTLWTVAATAIRSSDSRRITIAWRRLYAANRARLGPDPALLPVGMRLCLPSGM